MCDLIILSDHLTDSTELPLGARINNGRPACGFLTAHSSAPCLQCKGHGCCWLQSYILSLVESSVSVIEKSLLPGNSNFPKGESRAALFLFDNHAHISGSLIIIVQTRFWPNRLYLWHRMEALWKCPRAMRLLNPPLLSTRK